MTLLAGTLVQARREYLADRAVMMQRRADLLDEWEKAAREARQTTPG
jgi:hypothetical protein